MNSSHSFSQETSVIQRGVIISSLSYARCILYVTRILCTIFSFTFPYNHIIYGCETALLPVDMVLIVQLSLTCHHSKLFKWHLKKNDKRQEHGNTKVCQMSACNFTKFNTKFQSVYSNDHIFLCAFSIPRYTSLCFLCFL